ncbi:class I SAM-dependent methyltransferase [Clostridium magnum]|uniref:Demethylrebeccamycin-D-glucose O-methyltransferase n=1 Tax=Clostridium magnum DSM 2767 TaxID=1121326 RepID=A0A161XB78_9CLOT|nr:class I SAM-dependent methyltransferase [Clostridium magnum]KZL91526.1 demethylrebeccamycin-D-glucose O-methyltransferase [Clostridium magnum DSM 2767]SHH46132.1 Methyltransferase domain-containing protein [Clostridium magnum DSM 2767]
MLIDEKVGSHRINSEGCELIKMHKFDIKNLEKLDNSKRRESMPPEETLKKFKIGDRGTMLDIGCGIGYFTIPAAKILTKGNVIGVDIMPEILDIAREKAGEISNIEFKKSEEYSFPEEDSSIDYVFVCNVVHEIENKVRFFTEVKRVLKNEGYIYIIDWEKRDMKAGPPVNERFSKEEVRALVEPLGFTFLEEVNINTEHYGLIFKV